MQYPFEAAAPFQGSYCVCAHMHTDWDVIKGLFKSQVIWSFAQVEVTRMYLKLLYLTIVLLRTHSLQSLVLLLVLAHPLIRVCATPHTHTHAHTHAHRALTPAVPDSLKLMCDGPTAGPESQDCTWLFLSIQLAGSALSLCPLIWREGGFLTKCQKSRTALQWTRRTLKQGSTLSRNLLAAFGNDKLERSQLSTPQPFFDLLI